MLKRGPERKGHLHLLRSFRRAEGQQARGLKIIQGL